MIGKTLGHYQITSQLGKGGMGEVFQAKDQVLGREVAIKVLPEEFARDTDRVARFQREAKVLASLNHPNIAAIHGLEQSEGTNFLVLELVEGETLADRLKGGAIPVEESLKLALQIAEALEAAHEKGVIHRDLKPANIKVTPDSKVKVLDFGLAKAFAGEQAELNLSNSPTLSDAATQQGVILGTAAYMSPEQAKGKAVDKRSDVWAFGCVVFEMLTGRSLFSADDVSQTLARVLERQPDFSSLPQNLHPRIMQMLERCLEKDAANRYGSVSDARVDIEKALDNPGGVFVRPAAGAEHGRKLRAMLPWVAATAILSIMIGGVAVWKLRAPGPGPVTRFYYELPKDQQFNYLGERAFAVSPDGRQLVYSTSGGLYLRGMDELNAKLIPGTEANPYKPFFSPDGKWVGYVSGADRQLKKIAVTGGAPVALMGGTVTLGFIDWRTDGTIVFAQPGTGVMRVSANGGNPETVVKAENQVIISPQILADGKSVIYTRLDIQPFKVMVQSLKSGQRKVLIDGDTARYLPTGHIVYAVGNNLFAIPFDFNKLEVAGGPVSVIEGVLRTGGAPQYAVSDSGTLAYIPGRSGAVGSGRTLVWVDRNGKEEPLAATPDIYSHPKISPDGRQVALTVGPLQNSDIWIWDVVRKNLTRLTFDPSADAVPLWSPDGKRIAFMSSHEGSYKVYWKAADGTGKVESLSPDVGLARLTIPSSWSGDGKTLELTVLGITGAVTYDIGALSMEGEHKWRLLLQEKYNEVEPKVSPNGRWMAYTSDESGQNQVYVRPFPEVDIGGRWQVSTSGGYGPLWSPDGRELFYRNGDAVMAVSVKTEPTFSLETPKTLFRGTYASPALAASISSLSVNSWDISPDGKRFLMIKPPAPAGAAPTAAAERPKINIVMNWTEELKQRVPVK